MQQKIIILMMTLTLISLAFENISGYVISLIKIFINFMQKKYTLFFLCAFIFFNVPLNAFTITQSGSFVLGGDLTESGTVIRISTSNLTVDLGNYIVSGGTNGIVIDSGLSNVNVINGRINSNTRGITIGSGCTDITLQNLEISNCSRAALEVNGIMASPVMRLSLEDIKAELSVTAASVTDSVLLFSFVTDLTAKNVQIAKNGASTVNLRGISLVSCDKGTFENVTIICNQGATFQGFRIEDTTNTTFDSCKVRVNTATDDLVGFQFTGGTSTSGNFCEGCFVTNNTSTNGPFAGFELLSFVIRNTLQNCTSSNNSVTSSSGNCYGFNYDQPTFCSTIDCRAEYNQVAGTGMCAGFNISTSGGGTTGTKVCEFYNNRANYNNAATDGASFGIRAFSGAAGNTDNLYVFNIGARNGPSAPIFFQQIVSNFGNPGGVPLGSIVTLTLSTLSGTDLGYFNVRIT